jgi:hypothetical protein
MAVPVAPGVAEVAAVRGRAVTTAASLSGPSTFTAAMVATPGGGSGARLRAGGRALRGHG